MFEPRVLDEVERSAVMAAQVEVQRQNNLLVQLAARLVRWEEPLEALSLAIGDKGNVFIFDNRTHSFSNGQVVVRELPVE